MGGRGRRRRQSERFKDLQAAGYEWIVMENVEVEERVRLEGELGDNLEWGEEANNRGWG